MSMEYCINEPPNVFSSPATDQNCESRASATIYSIIETAKENRLNPYAYLNHLFEILPNLDSRDDATLEALLPWNVTLP